MTKILSFILGILGLGGMHLGATPPCQVQQGCTGTSTVPVNYVLIGLNTGRLTAVSTSSLGITAAGDGTFSTTSASYFSSVGLAYSTTSTLADLTTYNKGFFFSTTSASAFSAAGLGFSTTSANFWSSVGLGHSTTSVAYQLSQNTTLGNSTSTNFFATLASSTNLFATGATTTYLSVAGTASTTNLTVSGVRSALLLTSSIGVVSAYGGASACSSNNFVTTISATGATTCGSSTISGVSLGSNLNSFSVGGDFTGTSYNGSAAVSDWAIKMSATHTWTALQQFSSNASTTQLSAYTGVWFGATATSSFSSTGLGTFNGFISQASSSFTTLSGITASTTNLKISGLGTPAGQLLAAAPDGSVIGTTTATGANPTGTVGLSAVNGSATTFLRSDGAPALSQSITPTWTGLHIFNTGGIISSASSSFATLFATNGTSTGNFTFSGILRIPNSASLTTTSLGSCGIDTTTGQLRCNYDGTNSRVYVFEDDKGFNISTSTAAYKGAFGTSGTTSNIVLANFKRARTLTDLYCVGNGATSTIRFGNGSATTTLICGKDIAGSASSISTAFSARAKVFLDIGTLIGTSGDSFTITPTWTVDAD